MTYIIAEPCIDIKDKSCIDVCPVDCIHEYDRMLVIDPEECIDCGACEPECPVEAIYPEDALPDKWQDFVKINYAFPDADVINDLVRPTRPSTTSRTACPTPADVPAAEALRPRVDRPPQAAELVDVLEEELPVLGAQGDALLPSGPTSRIACCWHRGNLHCTDSMSAASLPP